LARRNSGTSRLPTLTTSSGNSAKCFCMPCSRVSSDVVVLGPVAAVQGSSNVRGRLAGSGEIWVRWSLVLVLVAGSTPFGIGVRSTDRPSPRRVTKPGCRGLSEARRSLITVGVATVSAVRVSARRLSGSGTPGRWTGSRLTIIGISARSEHFGHTVS